MTPIRKTCAILFGAAAVTAGALFLTLPPAASPGGPHPLGLSASLESGRVLTGTHEGHLAIAVRAPERAAAAERPPVNIAVVIDRSGSMAGAPLEDAKRAARHLIGRLEQGDRFAVIAYGSEVETLVAATAATESAKAQALAALDRLYDDGGTNLSGGLIAGVEAIAADANLDSISRVVLISDGQANEGITAPRELRDLAHQTGQRGIAITSVGVGLDFDERTLTNLAVASGGNYYFAESSDSLASIFQRELEQAGATVAASMRLEITPTEDVDILEAYGYELTRAADGTVSLTLADLRAGQMRNLVLRVRVRANQAGPIELGQVALVYRDVFTGEPGRLTYAARSIATADQAEVDANRLPDMIRNIERARTGYALDRATELYENGHVQAARALLDDRMRNARSNADAIGDTALLNELQQAAHEAESAFIEAPAPSSKSGRRAQKQSRKRAYDLMK